MLRCRACGCSLTTTPASIPSLGTADRRIDASIAYTLTSPGTSRTMSRRSTSAVAHQEFVDDSEEGAPPRIVAVVKLEALQATATVRGILTDALVTVASVRWFGSDALELTYAGREVNWAARSYRDDESRLEIVEQGRPWSFDGDGELSRLVSEGAAYPPRASVRPHAGGAHLAGGAATSDYRGVRSDAPPAATAVWAARSAPRHRMCVPSPCDDDGRRCDCTWRRRAFVL